MPDHPEVKKGYVICQTSLAQLLEPAIEAISWKNLPQILQDWLEN